ncbi:hypothetical protein B0O99DRAFT_549387 [Bisporella sp. PMI_857]|nr:hypothetical protein B0O99DRAFT_549387 [Bisporella sp. PMI_857]
MVEKNKQGGLKVIIVGGSIAGLVLAHSLYRAGIDFVVLEARDRVDPQVGASIGLFANGLRILDQIGIYDDIEPLIEPPVWLEVVTGKGILVQKVDFPHLMNARMGYPISFLERQRVLKILLDRLPEKKRVLVNKKVTAVDQVANGVVVQCDDGSKFEGDIVAGADGVHSRIRREMWRHAESKHALKNLEKDKMGKSMLSEYRCLFGISSSVPGLENNTQYRAFNEDWSFLVVPGKGDRCFWFIFERMDQTYHTSNIPQFTKADEPEFIKPYLKRYVSEHVTFDTIWKRKICTSLTALQEAQYSHWTFDRFVCLGDSIHKMTPNIGQGGNWAIESAAALANNLNKLNKTYGKTRPSIKHIRHILVEYQQSRQVRTKSICDTANLATRVEAMSNYIQKLIVFYVVPHGGDIPVDIFCETVRGAEKLDFLPLPEKSLNAAMPYRNAQSGHQSASSAWRMFWTLPLLGLLFAARLTLGPTVRPVYPLSGNGEVPFGNKTMAVHTAISYSMKWINSHAFLSPVHELSLTEERQIIEFMGDMAPLQIIWTIESMRRGNVLTFAALSTIFSIAGQLKGFGYAAPTYYFLHYIQSSLDKYAAPDNRLVPTKYAKTVVAAVGVGYVLPSIYHFLGLSTKAHQYINGIWQLFPIWTAIFHRFFASFVSDTTFHDRIENPRADMPYLRQAYAFGAAVSGVAHLYLWITATGDTRYLLPGIGTYQNILRPATPGFRLLMRNNELITLSSGLIWLLLHFRDLKKSRRLKATWAKVIGILASTIMLIGPGAAMAVGWAWREELLAERRNDKPEGRTPTKKSRGYW